MDVVKRMLDLHLNVSFLDEIGLQSKALAMPKPPMADKSEKQTKDSKN